VRRALIPLTLMTLFIVGFQLSIFSTLRISGVVIMIVWLWPLVVGLAGLTSLSIWTAVIGGVFFDTHSTAPFGLTAAVGVLLGYGASRLGKEGVGDLDSAAWWVTPAIAALGGFLAPLFYVMGGAVELSFSLWRSSVVDMMLVNALAFALLSRPLTRLARSAGGIGARARR
jgi:cell shape-determining protein MreD